MKFIHNRVNINVDKIPSDVYTGAKFVFILFTSIFIITIFFYKPRTFLNLRGTIQHSLGTHFITAKSSGVVEWRVNDLDDISKGQLLGYFNSDGLFLQNYKLAKNVLDFKSELIFENPEIILYEIDSMLSNDIPFANKLLVLFEKINDYIINNNLLKKKYLLNHKRITSLINVNRERNQNLSEIDSLINEIWIIEQHILKRNVDLLLSELISKEEFEKRNILSIKQKKELLSIKDKLVENEIDFSNLNVLLLEIESDFKLQIGKDKNEIKSALKDLLISVKEWLSQNLILAEVEGKLNIESMFKRITVNYHDTLGLIYPNFDSSTNYNIYFFIPQEFIRFININHSITLKIDEYPFLEYGILKGKVTGFSSGPNSNVYKCTAKLVSKNKLITNYNYKIPEKNSYSCQVDVKLYKENIFMRIMRRLKWSYKN